MQGQDLRVKTRRSGCILMAFNVKCFNHSADRLQEEIFTGDKRVTGACFIFIWASEPQRRTMMCTWSIMIKIAANMILRSAVTFLSDLLLNFLDLGTGPVFIFVVCHYFFLWPDNSFMFNKEVQGKFNSFSLSQMTYF